MIKVLLAYRVEGTCDQFLATLPVGLGIMSAVLRKGGIDARVMNLSAEPWSSVKRIFRAAQPDIVALSVFTHNRVASKHVAQYVKETLPDCWVICGGPHASHAVNDLLAWTGVDGVVVGEGEEVLQEIVRRRQASGRGSLPDTIAGLVVAAAAGHVLPVTLRAPISNLDQLPFAHLGLEGGHGIDPRHQAEFIITSRGCPSACIFCSSPGFWGSKIRFRSASSVLQELWSVHNDLGLLYFSIRDDTFTADRNRAIDICRRIINEKLYILWNCQSRVSTVDEELLGWMKRAGCECIQFGIESGSQRMLELLGKKITLPQIRRAIQAARNVGLQVSVYLIAGVAEETGADIAATEALLAEVLPHDGQVSPLAYFPGTALFLDAVATGQISSDLFDTSPAPALYVRSDAAVARTVQRLIAFLQCIQSRATYQPADFIAQQQRLGYCHATNLQWGEWYAANGQWAAAQEQYAAITHREPENPWGWLALGELALQQEKWREATVAFQKVHQLVPRHLPVLHTLADAALAAGNRRQVEKWRALAEKLTAA